MVRVNGAAGYIMGARLFNETENQAVQYDLILSTEPPTGEMRDNYANTTPLETQTGYVGKITFPQSTAGGATVATTTEVGPSTVGRVPKAFKCESDDDALYGVLVTNTIYTQTGGDNIKITLSVEQY